MQVSNLCCWLEAYCVNNRGKEQADNVPVSAAAVAQEAAAFLPFTMPMWKKPCVHFSWQVPGDRGA